MTSYFVEMTDTFGGEANYSWVNRFLVTASSFRGAISKVTRKTGYHARNTGNYGDMAQYKANGACIVYFIIRATGEEAQRYSGIESI